MTSITVIGAGSWGTAIAIHLARLGNTVCLWGRDATQIAEMQTQRENSRYLPGIAFPPSLHPVENIDKALSTAELLVLAVPSHAFRDTIVWLQSQYADQLFPAMVWLTKGLDPSSHQLLHHVAIELLGNTTPLAILSGPNFAREIALDLPAAATLASFQTETADKIARIFHGGQLRVYSSTDVIGVEIGGAIKNVLAIATGIAEGLGCGANAQAALITRGMTEMMRLGKTLGAMPETLMGLSGLGDLILTCTSNQSRNRRFGLALGQGASVAQAKQTIHQVVEGMQTTQEIYQLAQEYQIEMPIITQVYKVIYLKLPPAQALQNLLLREQKKE